jgi:hypothetical protein
VSKKENDTMENNRKYLRKKNIKRYHVEIADY